jgi:hypothetical protein
VVGKSSDHAARRAADGEPTKSAGVSTLGAGESTHRANASTPGAQVDLSRGAARR